MTDLDIEGLLAVGLAVSLTVCRHVEAESV